MFQWKIPVHGIHLDVLQPIKLTQTFKEDIQSLAHPMDAQSDLDLED